METAKKVPPRALDAPKAPIVMHVTIGQARTYGQGLAAIGDNIAAVGQYVNDVARGTTDATAEGHYEFTLDGLLVTVTVQEANDGNA